MNNRGKVAAFFYVIMPEIVYIGVTIGVSIILEVYFSILQLVLRTDSLISEANLSNISLIIAAIISIFILRTMYKQDIQRGEYLANEAEIDKVSIILIALLAIPLSLGANHLVDFTHIQNIDTTYQEVEQTFTEANFFIQFAAVVIFAPIVEELINRNLVQRRLNKYFSNKVAIIFSAIIFGLSHMNITQFIYAFLLGVVLGMIFDKYRNVWYTIALHLCCNLTSVLSPAFSSLIYKGNTLILEIVFCAVEIVASVLLIYLILRRPVTRKNTIINNL